MKEVYTKSLEDEIDWKVIDQLYGATTSFSTASIELKKLYFVLVGIAVPSLIKLSSNKLDLSLFITTYLLTITFWMLDSFTYYFQESLREKMNNLFLNIRKRNSEPKIQIDQEQQPFDKKDITLDTKRDTKTRLFRSFFNNSQLLYLLIFVLTSLALFLFLNKNIK